MKHGPYTYFAALLPAILLLGMSGCAPAAEKGPSVFRIGVALYQQDDTFISTVTQNLEQFARQSSDQDCRLNLSVADGRGNQAVQNEQVDRFLTQGYNMICVNIVDRTAAAVIIDKARGANVPVIFFNREPVEEDLARWDQAYYVGSDAEQSGLLQGKIVLDAWREAPDEIDRNGDGFIQYVMLEGEPGHQDALLRTENSIKVLTRAGIPTEKLANATANWQRGQAAARMTQWMSQFGSQIEVVFANNDDMALGAIDACLDLGMEESALPFVVGVDATPAALEAVKAGTLKGTVLNDGAGQARAMIDMACAIAKGGNPLDSVELKEGKYLRLPYTTVTTSIPIETASARVQETPPDTAFLELRNNHFCAELL